MSRFAAVVVCTAIVGSSGGMSASAQPPALRDQAPLPPVQVTYLRLCGGCHGIEGVSAPEVIPTLRDQVGRFLCTPGGRSYVVRLPNIALAPLSDEELAELLNFVVFIMGGPSTPAGAAHYDVAEVSRDRAHAITSELYRYRQRILAEVARGCR